MATRKKKDPGTMSGLPKDYPYVTIGTHLTVTEYADGRRELAWDDEALLKEVRAAIASAGHVDREDILAPRVNSNPPKKPAAKKAPAKKTVKKTTKE
jgi:hypothetical protein